MTPPVQTSRHVRINALMAGLFWTACVGASLGWNVLQQREQALRLARIQAEANINKDIAFRRWATSHGGVYVRQTGQVQPDQYLNVPERDVVTTGGQKLTLMNPAYMMRQIMEQYSDQYGIKGHITSLAPINPKNLPDEWERQVLRSFAQGATEAMETGAIDGVSHLRLMLPMHVENGCVLCHAGVHVGEILGGVSTSVPVAPFETAAAQAIRGAALSHGGIWLIGLAGIGAVARRARQRAAERERAKAEISELNASLERRVAERTAELERANRDLEAFSYSVSHDLRAPLRAINGFAHLLLQREDERLSEEGKGLFARITYNSNRLGELIDDVLDYSRAGRTPLERVEVDLGVLARAVAGELAEAFPGTVVEVRELPVVAGDETMLRQVFANLIGNALKFSAKAEQPRVEVGSAERDGRTVIHVRDNGVGFDMRYAGRLFGMFQRVHSEAQFPGTGVGLAIVQRLVERHGGRVWAEAEPDKGATFFFTLDGEEG